MSLTNLSTDDFVKSLLAAGRSDAPPPGACERALTALQSAPAASGSSLLLKLLGLSGIIAAVGTVAHLATRPQPSVSPPQTAVAVTAPPTEVVEPPRPEPAAAIPPRTEPVPSRRSKPLPSLATIEPPRAERATTCSKDGKPYALEFENHLDKAVVLDWIDYDCDEKWIADVEPHSKYTGTSYDASPLWVRDRESGKLLKRFAQFSADSDPAEVRFDGTQTPPVDGPPAECTPKTWGQTGMNWIWVNASPKPIDIYWVDSDCKEVLTLTLKPGERHYQNSYWAYPWRYRDSATQKLLHEHVPHFTPHRRISVP